MSELPDPVPATDQPTIPAGDLVLRPWRYGDAHQVVKAFGDPEIRGWSGHPVDSEAQALDWIDRWEQKWKERSAAGWAVVRVTAPEDVLGHVALRTLFVGEMAECSYWVMPDHRGAGIAPQATRALADRAFREFDLSRLEVVHSVRNRRSCRVALKAGFTPEGIQRSLQKHQTGGVHDMHLHSRVRPAQTRARALDRALLGVVSHVTLWTTASLLSAALALLTLVYRFAAVLPLLLAAGVLGLRLYAVHRPRLRYERRSARSGAHG